VWPKELQGHVLGSFFYGYLISQIPGGILAERYGGKWVYGGSLLLATIATLLTPVAAALSFRFLIFLRVIVGVGSVSVCFPAPLRP
jgi:ACS family sodium-dependent inorganic phosphate cotransporter-like MFS transporter 5